MILCILKIIIIKICAVEYSKYDANYIRKTKEILNDIRGFHGDVDVASALTGTKNKSDSENNNFSCFVSKKNNIKRIKTLNFIDK